MNVTLLQFLVCVLWLPENNGHSPGHESQTTTATNDRGSQGEQGQGNAKGDFLGGGRRVLERNEAILLPFYFWWS
jgi:hypothetical protein